MRSGQTGRGYHHGELRDACVAAGLRLLVEEGRQAVSLREVARRCGVSPRAPYRHFADRLALLAAIAEAGFVGFGEALTAALASRTGATPAQRLEALAAAYVDFALAQPSLMMLMFSAEFGDRRARFPALDAVAVGTFALLRREVAALTGGPAEDEAVDAALAWAMVHGLAELQRNGQFALVLPAGLDRAVLIRAAVRLWSGRPG